MKDTPSDHDPRPASAVSTMCGLMGLVGLTSWLLFARNFGDIAAALGFSGFPARADGPYAAMCCVFATGVPMVLWSILVDKVHLRPSTGIDWSIKRPVDEALDSAIVKLAGYWATWAIIAILYGLCRWYWLPPYAFSMDMFRFALPLLFAASIPYVVWVDRHQVDQRDGAWHFGAWIAGQEGWNGREIANHLRSWAVKGFFLAFMISIVPGGYAELVNRDFTDFLTDPVLFANILIGAMFVVDVQFATFGYIVTAKPLDSHIRTANPYVGGWLAALMCYPPFLLMNNGGILDYHVDTADWSYWFAGQTAFLWIWGVLLIFLTGIYAWATVAFGYRFSNLTHRGILTHGPFAWTRHPAYLSKNAFWWLATMPFLTVGGSFIDMVRNAILLAAVSAIYYWRAKTEEKHLMADPDYAAYWHWMERNAPVPRLAARIFGRPARPANPVKPAVSATGPVPQASVPN